MKKILLLLSLSTVVLCDVSHLLHAQIEEEHTPQPPPKPYAFGYAAGRFPGHIDRTHSEVSDGSGVVHGSYSYVDPRYQIRTVQYVADKNGFHPILSNPPAQPRDVPAVAAAKHKHLVQYAAIANSHQALKNDVIPIIVPNDSYAVQKAKVKHFDLYQKIAAEHARIAAERGETNEEHHEE